MVDVHLYTTPTCYFCIQAKQLLDSKEVKYRELSIARDPELRSEMISLSGRHTVPQIWIGHNHVGGCDDLMALESSGQLDVMLAGQNKCLEA